MTLVLHIGPESIYNLGSVQRWYNLKYYWWYACQRR